MSLNPNEILIDDSTPDDGLLNPVVDGEPKGRGYVDRDYALYPVEMFDPPGDMPLIPRSEWSARIKEQEEQKSRISDILLAAGIPSMDQGQSNYCWAHSTVGCVQALRAMMNVPYVPLSAYAVASTIMKGANDGGWSGLSAKFVRETGVPSQRTWPQGQFRGTLDRADAALHKTSEEWTDLTRSVYDQDLSFDQLATCLLSNIPCPMDMNWWRHAIMACDLVEVEPGSFGIRIRNSWGPSWGEQGFGVLRGSKAIPDGALAIRVTGASTT